VKNLNGNFTSPLIPEYPWKIHSSIYLDCVENRVAILAFSYKKLFCGIKNKTEQTAVP
jgi:hypothetical protein